MRRSAICLPAIFALSLLAVAMTAGRVSAPDGNETRDRSGATTGMRQPEYGNTVHFIFTADSLFEGGEYALDVLDCYDVKASFFFTGNFLRDSLRNGAIVRRTIDAGHYVGPHSDRHILLADWDEARTTLATPDSALVDMRQNYAELSRYGVDTVRAKYIVPPYEWYNRTHIEAYRKAGYLPLSPSAGLLTYRDYTTPDMEDYYSSDTIWDNFMDNLHNRDLDGAIIIIHLGTQEIRTDKFYYRLPEMLDSLMAHGYKATRF